MNCVSDILCKIYKRVVILLLSSLIIFTIYHHMVIIYHILAKYIKSTNIIIILWLQIHE